MPTAARPNPYLSRFQAQRGPSRPIGEINTTPLIDVMLVLVVMFIITVPVLTHTLEVPLPTGGAKLPVRATNVVAIDERDRLFWNGETVDRERLLNQLAASASMSPKPTIRFEPEANASYDQSAKTIALIKDSGVENFAFVGNHKYREFTKD